jgi:sulfite reductase (NADPH) flavoprotein alpha-component
VVENLVLTGRGSSKETRHVELSLGDSRLAYRPGDALGFVPQNDPVAVESLLETLALPAAAPVSLKKGDTTLEAALGRELEITLATPRFLQHWTKLSGAAELGRLADDAHAAERKSFLATHHIVDIVRRFPVRGIEAQQFVAGLRPLQPRLYSIASSSAALPGEAHLTVATVRYPLHGETRLGVASGYLATRGEPDAQIPVYVQSNPLFRLPEDERPILMIGAGTGVAPYRAFMQEREAQGARGKAWLFFGERHFRTDFLYQTEWQEFLKSGVLTRMSVAFSRDGAQKDYVQHRMLEHARDIYAWLEEGAYVYVCGDAARLAPDVHRTLVAIVADQGGLQPEAAAEYVRALQRDRRYQRDVY